MSIWFTSDTHFWHKNIINYTHRPFDPSDVEGMNEAIVEEWNSKVKPNDTIYHLGDVAFCGVGKINDILSRLNGYKRLVCGNHDRGFLKKENFTKHWTWIKPYYRLSGLAGYPTIILFHFPIAAWDEQGRGTWHLHGHSHGSYKAKGKILDVGLDGPLGFRILNIDEIRDYMYNIDIHTADGHAIVREERK